MSDMFSASAASSPADQNFPGDGAWQGMDEANLTLNDMAQARLESES